MLWYFAKLMLLLPILALLIWGSLKLTKHMQSRLSGASTNKAAVRLVDSCFLAPGMRIAIVEYRNREILLGCSRQGLTKLAEVDRTETSVQDCS